MNVLPKNVLSIAPQKEGVSIIERTDLAHVLCTTAVDSKRVAETLGRALDIEIPLLPGPAMIVDGRAAFWLSPRSWLIEMPEDQEDQTLRGVAAAFPDKTVHASRYNDYLCWLDVEGPIANDLMMQGGYVSLEPEGLQVGHLKRTIFADIPVIILRRERELWTVAVERSHARYFLDWMLDVLNNGQCQTKRA